MCALYTCTSNECKTLCGEENATVGLKNIYI